MTPRMTLRRTLPTVLAFALALLIAGLAGVWLAGAAERRTGGDLARALDGADLGWVQVRVDGLTAHLSGQAPSEFARLTAIRAAAGVVGAGRLSDDIALPRAQAAVAPVFRIEAMRNEGELSLVGLVPAAMGEDGAAARLAAVGDGVRVADMLQAADHPEPPGWTLAVDFAAQALARLPVAQVSVTAGRIEVQALVDNAEARQALLTELRTLAPRGQVLVLNLMAPRPVIAPFLLRLTLEDGEARLEACAADTPAAERAIEAAARALGLAGRFACPTGLGAPSPRWAQAVEQSLAALARLPAGTVTLSDLSVRLEAPHDTDRDTFDRAAGALEGALPEGFVLDAALRPAPEAAGPAQAGRPEFIATRAEDGQVTISGRVPDTRQRQAVGAYARARFGSDSVTIETRLDPALPQGWGLRVLAGLEALGTLGHGRLAITEGATDLVGVSGNPDATAQITQAMAARLGSAQGLTLRITYDEALDPIAQIPTPERCEGWVQAILAERTITFDPGEAQIDARSGAVLDAIAEVLRGCGELPFEVAGHTDSQGRAETNLDLSQRRAEAVVSELSARGVLVASMRAVGYGAERPVGDNDTPAGREANRRIEVALIRPAVDPATLSEAERAAQEAALVLTPQTPTEDQTRPEPRPARGN